MNDKPRKMIWIKISNRCAMFIERQRKEKWKRRFLHYHKKTKDIEIREMVDHIKRNRSFNMINCELKMDYLRLKVDCFYCLEKNRFYLIENSKKLYFSKILSKEQVISLYRNLKMEQDEKSPHRYIDEIDIEVIRKAKSEGKRIVIYELGAMEGMFSLNLVDVADEIHIFECDKEWEEALKCTFEPWSDKVKIVNKYVSDHSDKMNICIDDYCKEEMSNTLLIVKMDIEGNERYALKGMKHTLDMVEAFLCFVCVYHKKDDEQIVRKYFQECKIRNTPGYFCFHVADDYDVPFVRRCLLKINK